MANLKAAAAVDELVKSSNFSRQDIEALARRFSKLSLQNDKLDRSHFRDLLCDHFGVDDSLLMDRVFRCFDVDADNYISYDEYVKGMSVFLKGKFEEQMKLYDLNGDRYISKEEMFQMLKNCLVKGAEEDEDGVKDLVDLVLKKLDEDRDGRVSEADYIAAVSKENLLLEAFGQCLPAAKSVELYLGDGDMRVSTSAQSYHTSASTNNSTGRVTHSRTTTGENKSPSTHQNSGHTKHSPGENRVDGKRAAKLVPS